MTTLQTRLSSGAVASMLRQWIAGEITCVGIIGESWDDVHAGDVRFVLSNGTEIVIFNDCDSLDYVDEIRGGGQVLGNFDSWADDSEEGGLPLDMLTDEERDALLRIVKSMK